MKTVSLATHRASISPNHSSPCVLTEDVCHLSPKPSEAARDVHVVGAPARLRLTRSRSGAGGAGPRFVGHGGTESDSRPGPLVSTPRLARALLAPSALARLPAPPVTPLSATPSGCKRTGRPRLAHGKAALAEARCASSPGDAAAVEIVAGLGSERAGVRREGKGRKGRRKVWGTGGVLGQLPQTGLEVSDRRVAGATICLLARERQRVQQNGKSGRTSN